MDDDEISDIFNSELQNSGGRADISIILETAKQSIQAPYWNSKRTVRLVNELYSELKPHQQSIILSEKKELESLAQRQKQKRKDLSFKLESLIDGDSEYIGSTEFVRRFVARRHRIARDTTSKNLSFAFRNLSRDIYSSSFDPWSADAVISSGDRKVIREYAAEFAWHLICKGWNSDDMEDLGRRMRNSSYSISVFVALVATQDKYTYRYLLSLPNIKVGLSSPQRFSDGSTVIYPADYLKLHNLYKYHEVDLHAYDMIENMLEENSVIAVSVDAFARREGIQEALAISNNVLDAISYAHQGADLGHIEYAGPSKRIRWNRSIDSPPLHGMGHEGEFPGILDDTRIDTAKVISAAASKTGNLSSRLARGLRLFRQSNRTRPTINSLVDQVACMETLVSQEQTRPKNVIDSLVLIAGVTNEDQHRIESYIDLLYTRRNAALHSGKMHISNPGIIERAQRSIQDVLSVVIGKLADFVEDNPNADLEDFFDHVRKEYQLRHTIMGWKLYRDCIILGQNYRLEGQFVDSAERRVSDVQGNFRVEDPGHHFIVACDYRITDDSSVSISSRDKVWLEAEVNGREITIGPVAGLHSFAILSSHSSIQTRNYKRK